MNRAADKTAECRHDAAGMSIREFARQLGVTERTIRNAIARGYIPADVYEIRRSVNGREAPYITDPEAAGRAWYSRTPVRRGGRDAGVANGADLPPWARKLRALRDLTKIHRDNAIADDHESRRYAREAGLLRPISVLVVLVAEANRMVNETPGRERRRVRRVLDEYRRRVEAEVKKLPPARPRMRKRRPARRKSGPDT